MGLIETSDIKVYSFNKCPTLDTAWRFCCNGGVAGRLTVARETGSLVHDCLKGNQAYRRPNK